MLRSRAGAVVALVAVCLLGAAGWWYFRGRIHHDQPVLDEARSVDHAVSKLGAPDEDYFHDMDGALALTAEEVKGRNDHFWDTISRKSVGTLDFLKTLSSHPKLKASRDNRWRYLGLVNEPCFEKAIGPDPERFGLWLDKRKAGCPPDPFENAEKYAGVRVGARGRSTRFPAGSYFGWGTGVVGLRLFPNPDFDAAAEARWDAEKYYSDPDYYLSKDLVKPYRVGMSCGFCHVGPHPLNPPADPENRA